MDRGTFTETIQAFKYRKPFRPFTVALVNGDRFEVDFADVVAVRDGADLVPCESSLSDGKPVMEAGVLSWQESETPKPKGDVDPSKK